MTLGFTGIPLPDLLADIRIANLLVCPERVGWWVRRGWMETGVWFVQITLNPIAWLPVDVRGSVSPSLSLWFELLSGSATVTLTWLLGESYITKHFFLLAFLPVLTWPLTSIKKTQINTKVIAFKGNLGPAFMSQSDNNNKPNKAFDKNHSNCGSVSNLNN